jgi:hypothetical protein
MIALQERLEPRPRSASANIDVSMPVSRLKPPLQ